MMDESTLIVITGPTGSGKSALAIRLAQHIDAEIVSADSRQIFREIPIGTAAPSPDELAAVPHHFIATKSLDDYYSAACYENDALALLEKLWKKSPYSILCGGSMMYVDSVINGIDDIPTISPENRKQAMEIYNKGGLQQLRLDLLELDPVYYRQVDLNNPKRLIHALEIIFESGRPYSTLRTGTKKHRDFNIMKYALDYPREDLFERINRRVDAMIENGFIEEARRVWPMRQLNSLNTVGYKEMFAWFEGSIDYPTAVARMKKNTRVYAKKQLTWLKKDPEIKWLDPDTALETILNDISDGKTGIHSKKS